jgi:hypothetical protein
LGMKLKIVEEHNNPKHSQKGERGQHALLGGCSVVLQCA